jgi:hypothetical protein
LCVGAVCLMAFARVDFGWQAGIEVEFDRCGEELCLMQRGSGRRAGRRGAMDGVITSCI